MSDRNRNIEKNISEAVKRSKLPKKSYESDRQSFLDKAGVGLAVIVLGIILIEIIFLGFTLNCDAISNLKSLIEDYPDLLKPENAEMRTFISKQVSTQQNFIKDISKTILINVLLPILTAILGYIFASKQA